MAVSSSSELGPAAATGAEPTGVAASTLLRSLLWLALGGQVGAWLLFGLVLAPTAFRVLPSTELAGTVIGPVLSALHLYGAAAGLGLACLAASMQRGRLRVGLPLVMALACLYSQFGVSAEISEIRNLAFGPEGNADAAARFNQLHQISMAIYVAVGVAALALVALHAYTDASRERPRESR